MPEGRALEKPVPSPLAAQSMLPILSADEMAGHEGENEIANQVASGNIRGRGGAWDLIAGRVRSIPEYRERFTGIIGDREIHITDIAAAIGTFIGDDFRASNSVYDRALRGETTLSIEAGRGAELFGGKAGCVVCHSGPLFSDQEFHAIAMPQIGPGKSIGDDYYRDTGRFAVTGEAEDMYRFRTPSLRNVKLTAPYGHDGAYTDLEGVVRHHLDPVGSLLAYQPAQALLTSDFNTGIHRDFAALGDADELQDIAMANELEPVSLDDSEVASILAYLESLTDEASAKGRRGVPSSVPSGLPMDVMN